MDFNTVGSICAIIIAVCALSVSVWQGIETRKNYHLSVKPQIDYSANFSQNETFVGLAIFNQGVGPAIIDKMELFIDDKLVVDKGQYFWFNGILKELFCEDIRTIGILFISPGHVIGIGEKIPLIYLDSEDTSPVEIKALQKALSRCRVICYYSSIYNDKFVAKSAEFPLPEMLVNLNN